jgi:hypothetical protein
MFYLTKRPQGPTAHLYKQYQTFQSILKVCTFATFILPSGHGLKSLSGTKIQDSIVCDSNAKNINTLDQWTE